MAEDLEEDFEEGEASEEGGQEAPRKSGGGGKAKLILLIVVPILVVVAVAAGAYFAGFFDSMLHAAPKAEKPKPVAEEKQKEVMAAVFYDLPEILVNLNTQGRRQNFLKIRVSLELESALDSPKVEQVMPRIIDNFQVYLRELRVEDLQGSAGMLRLREELLTRVNAAAKPAKINDVLFKEMLIQ